jgi:ATP-binding cassette subfamily B protein
VEFSYNKDASNTEDPTISNLSVTIPAGSLTALVGPSGSGKSTISRLIARFWDIDAGTITIGGVDVKTLDPEHLMSYMSFVFQDVVLFGDTILNNIRIGNMDATDEQVLAAAKFARCDDFVSRLPDGYNTLLGENGATLSGGERQRISIARALLKDAPIILLDEATASLDPENEASIQQAISTLIEGKTVLVIAHRLRTIAGADNIIVLDKGRVAEQGRHDELISKGGLYNKLYTLQAESLGWSVGK